MQVSESYINQLMVIYLYNVCGTNWNDPEVGEIICKNIILVGEHGLRLSDLKKEDCSCIFQTTLETSQNCQPQFFSSRARALQ